VPRRDADASASAGRRWSEFPNDSRRQAQLPESWSQLLVNGDHAECFRRGCGTVGTGGGRAV
jgi:hypothetical protein